MYQQKQTLINQRVPLLTLTELLIIMGSIMLLIGLSMDWVSFHYFGDTMNIRGIELAQDNPGINFPEFYLVPLLAIFFLMGAIYSARRRQGALPLQINKHVIVAIGAICAMLVFILPLVESVRLHNYLVEEFGIGLFNNASLGWELSIMGAIFLFIGAWLPITAKNAAKLGISELSFARAEMTTSISGNEEITRKKVQIAAQTGAAAVVAQPTAAQRQTQAAPQAQMMARPAAQSGGLPPLAMGPSPMQQLGIDEDKEDEESDEEDSDEMDTCPHCNAFIPINKTVCPKCKKPVKFD